MPATAASVPVTPTGGLLQRAYLGQAGDQPSARGG